MFNTQQWRRGEVKCSMFLATVKNWKDHECPPSPSVASPGRVVQQRNMTACSKFTQGLTGPSPHIIHPSSIPHLHCSANPKGMFPHADLRVMQRLLETSSATERKGPDGRPAGSRLDTLRSGSIRGGVTSCPLSILKLDLRPPRFRADQLHLLPYPQCLGEQTWLALRGSRHPVRVRPHFWRNVEPWKDSRAAQDSD